MHTRKLSAGAAIVAVLILSGCVGASGNSSVATKFVSTAIAGDADYADSVTTLGSVVAVQARARELNQNFSDCTQTNVEDTSDTITVVTLDCESRELPVRVTFTFDANGKILSID